MRFALRLVFCFWTASLWSQWIFVHQTSWSAWKDDTVSFLAPEALDVDPAGHVYVADTGHHRIVKIDGQGRWMRDVGGFGWSGEAFQHPVSVWAGNGLDVLVADRDNHRIERYDKDLHYIASLAASDMNERDWEFGYPRDAALSSQGELFCLDGDNRRVLKLDVMGQPQITFGGVDAGEGRLTAPRRLLLTPEGQVLVSDAPGLIKVFDVYGNFLRVSGRNALKDPRGMDRLADGTLLVTDAGLRDVILIHPDGRTSKLSDLAVSFSFTRTAPVDVAIYRSRLYVLDRETAAIHLFLIKEGGAGH